MAREKLKCIVCGKEYEVCADCSQIKNWRAFTDTIEHYKVFDILRRFNNKKISREIAKEEFKDNNINIDGWENWLENCKVPMTEIMKEEPKKEKEEMEEKQIRQIPKKNVNRKK